MTSASLAFFLRAVSGFAHFCYRAAVSDSRATLTTLITTLNASGRCGDRRQFVKALDAASEARLGFSPYTEI